MLYLLQGDERHLLLHMGHTHGWEDRRWHDRRVRKAKAELHLPRFINLRATLRSLFPGVALVPDRTLLALLTLLCRQGRHRIETVKYIAKEFAFVRLMEGHPERGEGQPTKAERKTAGMRRYRDGGPSTPDNLAVDADANDGKDARQPTDYTGWGG